MRMLMVLGGLTLQEFIIEPVECSTHLRCRTTIHMLKLSGFCYTIIVSVIDENIIGFPAISPFVSLFIMRISDHFDSALLEV